MRSSGPNLWVAGHVGDTIGEMQVKTAVREHKGSKGGVSEDIRPGKLPSWGKQAKRQRHKGEAAIQNNRLWKMSSCDIAWAELGSSGTHPRHQRKVAFELCSGIYHPSHNVYVAFCHSIFYLPSLRSPGCIAERAVFRCHTQYVTIAFAFCRRTYCLSSLHMKHFFWYVPEK